VPLHTGHVKGHAPSVHRRSVQYTSAAGPSKMEMVGEVSVCGVRGGEDGGFGTSGDARSNASLGL
jgi:hypothetical protein